MADQFRTIERVEEAVLGYCKCTDDIVWMKEAWTERNGTNRADSLLRVRGLCGSCRRGKSDSEMRELEEGRSKALKREWDNM